MNYLIVIGILLIALFVSIIWRATMADEPQTACHGNCNQGRHCTCRK